MELDPVPKAFKLIPLNCTDSSLVLDTFTCRIGTLLEPAATVLFAGELEPTTTCTTGWVAVKVAVAVEVKTLVKVEVPVKVAVEGTDVFVLVAVLVRVGVPVSVFVEVEVLVLVGV